HRLLDQPLALYTFFYFVGETLKIESLAVSTSQRDVAAVTIGETVGWGNTPTWVEGQGFIGPGGSYGTEFIARESLGRAYAYASDEGRLIARFDSQEALGFYEWARTGEHVVPVPAGGASPRRIASLVVASGSLGDAVLMLPAFVRADKERWPLPPGLPKR